MTGCRTSPRSIPVEVKAELIERLHAAGLPVVEATSMVHPGGCLSWPTPRSCSAGSTHVERMPVLVPNERGLERALAAGVRHIAVFGSATETFAQRNLNRSWDEQFAIFEPVVARALRRGRRRACLRLHVLRRPLGG